MKKERPILMSTPMVQAILDGRKNKTRRIVKRPIEYMPGEIGRTDLDAFSPLDKFGNNMQYNNGDYATLSDMCPYGKPGDVLWVRETFKEWGTNPETYAYKADGFKQQYGGWEREVKNRIYDVERIVKWNPSLFMPKSACRLFLEITEVRVERLQEITEQDAIAEGVEFHKPVPGDGLTVWKNYTSEKTPFYGDNARLSFQTLWQSINGADSWDKNPWVWVVSFNLLKTS